MASRVTRVQGSQNTTSTSSWPNTGAYGSSVTAGDLLVCAGRFNGISSAPSISDTVGTTWTNAGGFLVGSSYYTAWYGLAGGTGSNTITLGSAGSFPEFVYGQWNNPDGSWTFGNFTNFSPSFQFSPWVGQPWTANLDDLVLSIFGNETGNYGLTQWIGNMPVQEVAGQNTGWMEYTRSRQVAWTPKVKGGGGTLGQFNLTFTPTGIPADTTPRHRQTPFAFANNSGSSLSKAFDANVLSGSDIFVWAASVSNPTTACTDSLSTTYTKILSAVQFSGLTFDVWHGVTTSGGANTVNVTYSGSGTNYVVPSEYINGAGLDGTVSASNAFPSPVASGNLTTTQADLLLAWVPLNQVATTSPLTISGGEAWLPSYMENDDAGSDNFSEQVTLYDMYQSSPGTYSFDATYPGFSRNCVGVVALSGGGSPPPGPGTSRARAYII